MINRTIAAFAVSLSTLFGTAFAQTNGGSLNGGTVETGGGNSGVSADGMPDGEQSNGRPLVAALET
jgi:hypothetical protein